MAYRLYRADALKKRESIRKPRWNLPAVAAYGVVVTYNEIEKYLDETFYTALYAWQMTKLWGLANGTIGWANEPTDYLDAVTALETERITMENEETMKSIEASKQKTSKPDRKGAK